MNNKIKIGIAILATSLTILIVLFAIEKPAQNANAGTIIATRDVLGTGTTTSATYKFTSSQSTTTSNIIVTGQNTDIVDLMIYPIYASSTAHVSFEVLSSSVPHCTTGATNSGWVDALSNAATVSAGNTAVITTASSTVGFVPKGQTGKRFQITNFNANCMKLYVGGVNVNLYIQANLKSMSF